MLWPTPGGGWDVYCSLCQSGREDKGGGMGVVGTTVDMSERTKGGCGRG